MAVIHDELITLLNYRIEQEELSSRIYLAMSIWADVNGYAGAAKVWKGYSQEELNHAQWAYSYLVDLDILPTVPPLKQPISEFKSLPDIIIASYKHELEITSQCQDFAQKALALGDHMTLELAQRYLKEQVEELAKTNYWVDRLKAFGTDKIALRLLDDEMLNK